MTEELLLREVLSNQREMQADIREIQLMLAEKRGERRVGLWMAGAAGAAASLLIKFLPAVFGAKL